MADEQEPHGKEKEIPIHEVVSFPIYSMDKADYYEFAKFARDNAGGKYALAIRILLEKNKMVQFISLAEQIKALSDEVGQLKERIVALEGKVPQRIVAKTLGSR